ncbi:MAG: hypothetical protein HVN35_10875 [Methanobacteriaceae archaeon]|nr:hypothetical protein [Methanobacteriaceae archaeon]
MKWEESLNIFLGILLIFLMLNTAFADDGPIIDKNQAQAIAQDYLNTHGYSSYKAVATDTLLAKVKEISTGKIYWMDAGQAKSEVREENPKINLVLNFVRVVNVLDKNGQIVGKIYVDSYNNVGEIVYKELPGSSSTEGDSGTGSGGSSGEDLSYNGTGNGNRDSEGILGTLLNLLKSIISFFQQIWISIFGGQ